jgi:predicted RNA-binding protein with PIN domain
MPYFLDGNNLIGLARKTSRPSDDDRAALIAELSARLRRTKARAVLFFDGGGEKGSSLGSLSIRPSRGTSADDQIVREVEKAHAPQEITVVTADRALARRVRGLGARTIDPAEFWTRLGAPSSGDEREPERQPDVEDWTRFFADPRNKLE